LLQGRTKQDLEGLLQKDGGLADMRANEGEAAGFGIYYDDSKYDYMQHLRVVGQNVDAQLVEAPRRNDSKGKALSMTLKEEEEHRAAVDQQGSYRGYLEGTAQAEGLRPDMDPALREVLEALEDDAYIADGVEEPASSDVATGNGEDFFSNLIAGSGKGDFRDTPFDDDDEDFLDEDEEGEYEDEIDGLDPNSAYAQEVLRFKKPKGAADSDDDLSDEEYEASEGGDTIAALQAASARRPPRKAGPSDKRSSASASAFSMSSSAMFRNEGLQTLDDRFDQVCSSHPFDFALA
jgi:protein LTV1